MALTLLTDFSETSYQRATRRLLHAAPASPEALWGFDWPALVRGHNWRGQGWHDAVQNRERLSTRLASAASAQQFADAANAITRWGGMTPFSPNDLERLQVAVGALARIDAGDKRALDDVLGRRIASTSKVYAMVDTSRWAIYDSRLARALALLVAYSGAVDVKLTALPQPPGRVAGRAAPGFPTLQAAATRQAALAFVYASWLIRGIAAELNARSIANPAGTPWTAMHVELALFTAGALPVLDTTDVGSSKMTPGPAAAAALPGAKAAAIRAMQTFGAMDLAEAGKNFGVTQAERQAAKRNAFRNCVRYAQQTKSRMVRLQFADGEQRYVVYKDDEPIAAFPPYDGDLSDALAYHEAEAITKLTPEDALEHRKSARAKRSIKEKLPWGQKHDELGADETSATAQAPAVTGAMLSLPAGDPLGEDELLDEVYDDPEA